MDNKCTKYECLFIFSDNETLEEHVRECEECKKEDEIQKKVSSLLDEVKFYYRKRNNTRRYLKTACAAAFLLVSTLSLGLAITNEDLIDTIKYGNCLTAEDLGFPVDSYGLLMVDE